MKKYNKYAMQICIFLLIVSGIFNIIFITTMNDTKLSSRTLCGKNI